MVTRLEPDETLRIEGSVLKVGNHSYELQSIKSTETLELRADRRLLWAGLTLLLSCLALVINSYTPNEGDGSVVRTISIFAFLILFSWSMFLITFDTAQYVYVLRLVLYSKKWLWVPNKVTVMCSLDVGKIEQIASSVAQHLSVSKESRSAKPQNSQE